MAMDKQRTWNVGYWLVAVLALLAVQSWWQTTQRTEVVPYSEFERFLADGKVSEVVVSDQTMIGQLKTPEGRKTAIAATRVEPDVAARLEKYGVPYRRVVESNILGTLLSWVLPAVIFFAVWFFLFRRFAEKQGMGGGFLSIGKSRAKVYVETDTGVKFDDVAGVDESKDELREVVDFLKNPQEYGRLGARMPKGVLLVGPPGTGKTLLARAVAGEAGVPFFSISGSEFVEMFVGVGAARVRDLFEQARQKAPAIIFIDELDAMGRARGAFPGGGHDEKEQTLNQLLVEMDGFDPSSGLVIIAATNRPEILDPALLRAGRFDRQVLVDRPDRLGPHRDPARACAQGQARARCRPGAGGRADRGLQRRGPRQPGERSGIGGHAAQGRCHHARPTSPLPSSASWPGSRSATACSTRRRARRSPSTRWGTRC